MRSERPKSKRGAARNAPKRRDSSGSDKPSFKKNTATDAGKSDGKDFGNKKFTYKNKPKKMVEKSVDDKVRLNRFLANAGICSRREADKLIETGVVSINNKVVTELGTKVSPNDVVHYGGMLLQSQRKQYVLLNKPKNYITTMDDPEERQTVMELISKACNERIYPVGRLDRATSGLLLFTNDGEMTKRLTHPSGKVKKIYHVTVDKNITQKDLIALVEGIQLEDGPAGADKAFYLAETSKSTISIELHSGRNRIIRRMMEHLGYKVTKLDRVQFAGLTKKDIPRGRFRHLSEKEVGLMHRVCGLIPQDNE
ncbi:MAG: 23S rRNA pseudouridine2605 synthase [Vicingaceae bacterium]|jgi:23S rRNA pseudouridine2605 synthase